MASPSVADKRLAAAALRVAAERVEEARAICAGNKEIATRIGNIAGGLKSYAEWLELPDEPVMGPARRNRTPIVLSRNTIHCHHCGQGYGVEWLGRTLPGPSPDVGRVFTWDMVLDTIAKGHSASCPYLSVDPRPAT